MPDPTPLSGWPNTPPINPHPPLPRQAWWADEGVSCTPDQKAKGGTVATNGTVTKRKLASGHNPGEYNSRTGKLASGHNSGERNSGIGSWPAAATHSATGWGSWPAVATRGATARQGTTSGTNSNHTSCNDCCHSPLPLLMVSATSQTSPPLTLPSPYLGTLPLGTLPENLETLRLPSFDADNPTSLAELVSRLAQDQAPSRTPSQLNP